MFSLFIMLWRCCRHLFWRHVPVLFCVVTWLTKPGHQKPLPMTSPQRSRMVDADIMISATINRFSIRSLFIYGARFIILL